MWLVKQIFAASTVSSVVSKAAPLHHRKMNLLVLFLLTHVERLPLILARYSCHRVGRMKFLVNAPATARCQELCNASCSCVARAGNRAHIDIAMHAEDALDTLFIHADMWTDIHALLGAADQSPASALLPYSATLTMGQTWSADYLFHHGGNCIQASLAASDRTFGEVLPAIFRSEASPDTCMRAMSASHELGLVGWDPTKWLCCDTWQDLVFIPRAQLARFRIAALGPFRDVNQELATHTILQMVSLAKGIDRPRFVGCAGTCCATTDLSSTAAQHALCVHRVALDYDPSAQQHAGAARCARDHLSVGAISHRAINESNTLSDPDLRHFRWPTDEDHAREHPRGTHDCRFVRCS